jgi:succinate dehydrogenase / fumarate reductase iron-sulfur subunit
MPQGSPERLRRVRRMVEQMEAEGFGGCSNEGECEAVCPKSIATSVIQRMNRDYVLALVKDL